MRNGFLKQKLVHILFVLLAVLQFTLLIRRMLSDYSATLYWDEWDSRLSMNLPFKDLQWELFWKPHNEHRLVISKLFFWLDFAGFKGSNVPLLIMNLTLAGTTIWVVYQILMLKERNISKSSVLIVTFCFTFFTFSVLQIENFSWGFQIQFFLSVLLPLLSFYFYLNFALKDSKKSIAWSYLFCVLSIGTMASGNFAIVVILITGIYLKRKASEIAFHLVGVISLLTVYTHNYNSLNASPITTLIQHPDFIIKYMLVYFTSPLNQLTNSQIPEFVIAFTLLIFLLVLKNIVSGYRNLNQDLFVVAGSMMLAYSLLVSFASAGGRYYFGVNQASASRYTTISLLGWFGALLIIMHNHEEGITSKKFTWTKLSVLVSIIFIPFQIANSVSVNDVKSDRDMAAIALIQKVQDDSISIALYPVGQRLSDLSQSLISSEQSIFTSKFKKRYSELNTPLNEILAKPECVGFVDNIRRSSDKSGWLMNGWVASANGQSDFLDLIAIDASGRVVGAGISGFERKDVSDQLGSWARKTGFKIVSKIVPYKIVGLHDSIVQCKLNYGVKNE